METGRRWVEQRCLRGGMMDVGGVQNKPLHESGNDKKSNQWWKNYSDIY